MFSAVLTASLCFGAPLAAEPEILPAPRIVVAPPGSIPFDLAMEFERPDPRAHWQNYGVNQLGQWRPLVVRGPYDHSYYRDTGVPFPFTLNREREFMRNVVGTPYRAIQYGPPPWVEFGPFVED